MAKPAIDLSTLTEVLAAGWGSLNEAFDINERGQIVGWGMREGAWRAFLMTPLAVSAPPTLLLLGIGLALLGVVRGPRWSPTRPVDRLSLPPTQRPAPARCHS